MVGAEEEGEERREDAHELAQAEESAFSLFELNEFSERGDEVNVVLPSSFLVDELKVR